MMPDSAISCLLGAYSAIAPTERGGFALVKRARRFIPRSRWVQTFHVPRIGRMRLDLATYPDCCMAYGLYELDTARVIRRLLPAGGWFADGGANVGYFTLLASRCVGPNGRIDAFEPDPENRARLEDHLRDNAAANVKVHPLALSEEAGNIEMSRPNEANSNHGMATAFAALAPGGERYSVPTTRMDVRLEGVPDVVKLDVEGAERIALRGMTRLLQSVKPPALIVEHNHATSRAAGYTPADLMREILAVQPRYRVYWIGWRLWPIRSPEALQEITRQGNLLIRADASGNS